MKFDKIVYIRYIPLTSKIFTDFYMQQIMDMSLAVEYWDISKLFFTSTAGQEDSSHLCKTLHFENYPELENAIKETDAARTLFVIMMSLEGGQRKLYRLFSKYDCRYCIFGCNMLPVYTYNNCSRLQRVLRIRPAKLMNFIRKRRFLHEMESGKIKGYEVIFQGGESGWQGIGNITKKIVQKSRKIKINSNDYDICLKLRSDRSRIVDEDYILFLDEYLPLHPDAELLQLGGITPEEYYPALNAYLDRMEAQFGLRVVIAAHPKALRYKTEDFFHGRPVYFGQSAILSKDANFVIAHDSTSINYPIIFGKKIYFITSDAIALKNNDIHLNILNIAPQIAGYIQYIEMNIVIFQRNCIRRNKINFFAEYYGVQCSVF